MSKTKTILLFVIAAMFLTYTVAGFYIENIFEERVKKLNDELTLMRDKKTEYLSQQKILGLARDSIKAELEKGTVSATSTPAKAEISLEKPERKLVVVRKKINSTTVKTALSGQQDELAAKQSDAIASQAAIERSRQATFNAQQEEQARQQAMLEQQRMAELQRQQELARQQAMLEQQRMAELQRQQELAKQRATRAS